MRPTRRIRMPVPAGKLVSLGYRFTAASIHPFYSFFQSDFHKSGPVWAGKELMLSRLLTAIGVRSNRKRRLRVQPLPFIFVCECLLLRARFSASVTDVANSSTLIFNTLYTTTLVMFLVSSLPHFVVTHGASSVASIAARDGFRVISVLMYFPLLLCALPIFFRRPGEFLKNSVITILVVGRRNGHGAYVSFSSGIFSPVGRSGE